MIIRQNGQDALYLPSDSELRVSIWRLTSERKVWYEWHAESFLVIPPTAGIGTGEGSFMSPLTPLGNFGGLPVSTPSPIQDLIEFVPHGRVPRDRRSGDSLKSTNSRESMGGLGGLGLGLGSRVVKIGQTSLHNPGGRSSWIGL